MLENVKIMQVFQDFWRGWFIDLDLSGHRMYQHMLSKTERNINFNIDLWENMNSFLDLRSVGVDCVTLGQYMQPTGYHLKVRFFNTRFLSYKEPTSRLSTKNSLIFPCSLSLQETIELKNPLYFTRQPSSRFLKLNWFFI